MMMRISLSFIKIIINVSISQQQKKPSLQNSSDISQYIIFNTNYCIFPKNYCNHYFSDTKVQISGCNKQNYISLNKQIKLMKPNYEFKFVLIGNSSVGKSSLLKRFTDDQFQQSYLATIGVDFKFKTFEIDGQVVKLQIWDTAGQERFRTLTTAYYKSAHGIFLVYDVQNPKSFEDIQNFWYPEVLKHGQQNIKLCVLGNKIDQQKKSVQADFAKNFCDENNLLFLEVSAKSGVNVQQAFKALTSRCMEIYPKVQREIPPNPVIESVRRKHRELITQSEIQKQSTKSCC